MAGPWMRAFLSLDPRTFLSRMAVPTLALFGGLDLQVPPKENSEAMAKAFEDGTDQALAERLVRAVEAGRDAGGQPEGQNSAALLVYGDQPFPVVDLRVDLHDEPEAELRRLWDWFSPMVPYYVQRAIKPVPRWWQWRMDHVPGWTARHLKK